MILAGCHSAATHLQWVACWWCSKNQFRCIILDSNACAYHPCLCKNILWSVHTNLVRCEVLHRHQRYTVESPCFSLLLLTDSLDSLWSRRRTHICSYKPCQVWGFAWTSTIHHRFTLLFSLFFVVDRFIGFTVKQKANYEYSILYASAVLLTILFVTWLLTQPSELPAEDRLR